MGGKTRLLNLSSNDYLGLASDTQLLQTFHGQRNATNLLDAYGLASLLTGHTAICSELEEEIAGQYGNGNPRRFSTAATMRMSVCLLLIASRHDLILADKLCHASLIDGMRLLGARSLRYQHLDYDHLRHLLAAHRTSYNRVFIVTESIFSMDGDLADIATLVRSRNDFNVCLYVDEAHAVGVRGPKGLGLCEELGVMRMDPDSAHSGRLLHPWRVCPRCPQIRDYMINTVRSLIFTTALPPVVVNWNLHVFRHACHQQGLRENLTRLSGRLRNSRLGGSRH